MGMELFHQRDGLSRELAASIDLMEEYGKRYAAAERDYQVELAKTALKLKDEGMSATMINLVIRGAGDVPDVRMKRDVAETMYKVANEHIQATKLELRLAEAQIEREWGQAKRSV